MNVVHNAHAITYDINSSQIRPFLTAHPRLDLSSGTSDSYSLAHWSLPTEGEVDRCALGTSDSYSLAHRVMPHEREVDRFVRLGNFRLVFSGTLVLAPEGDVGRFAL